MVSGTGPDQLAALPLEVVRDPERVAALLQPLRRRLLAELREPDSAAGLAKRLGLPRQQLNYHLRELEQAGLLELVEERRRGNCIERVLRATARRFVISPEVLGSLGEGSDSVRDHFSSSALVTAAARAIGELGRLTALATESGERPPTLVVESEVCFGSTAERDAFARELTETVARLVQRHHGASAAGGERFRLLLAAYPAPPRADDGGGG